VMAMLAWSGYTLIQSRAAPGISFIGRVCLFAAVGALLSLVLLGEGPDAVQTVGGSLILAGIWSSLRK
jgi:drug/metabolite transporter (DMT)-like permease